MNIYNSDSLLIRYEADQNCVKLQAIKTIVFEEFKEGLEAALVFAGKHNIKYWLLDCSKIGTLEEEEELWLQSYLFPKMMITLGEDNYIAVVLSDKCYNNLLNEAGKYGLKSYNTFIVINTFCEMPEAIAWLEKCKTNKSDTEK